MFWAENNSRPAVLNPNYYSLARSVPSCFFLFRNGEFFQKKKKVSNYNP